MSTVQILIIGITLAAVAILLAVLTDLSWGVILIFLVAEGAVLGIVMNRRGSRRS